jgi:hypothetical protein
MAEQAKAQRFRSLESESAAIQYDKTYTQLAYHVCQGLRPEGIQLMRAAE